MSRTKLFAGLILAAAVAPSMAMAGESSSGDWDWAIAPYLWAPAVHTNLKTSSPPVNSDNTTQFSDVVTKLQFALPVHLEGQGDDYGVLADVMYLSLSQERNLTRFNTTTDQKVGTFELAGVWSPGETRYQGFEAFAGLRYIWGSVDVLIDPVNPLPPSVKVGIDKSYADFMVGARYTAVLSDKWSFTMRGDTSFGSTDGTYGASGLFKYQTGNGAWVLGYRYMREKLGDHDKALEVKLYGPEVAYVFNL